MEAPARLFWFAPMSLADPGEGILEGRVAVVTGGSRGIGRAIALDLVGAGAVVVVGSRDEEAGARVAQESGGRIRFVPTDVARPDDCVRLIEAARADHGRVDILVNNAGVISEGTLEETSVEEWDRVLAINLRGPFLCSKFAVPFMRATGAGSIINIASINAFWAEPRLAAYGASKGGLRALTRAIAIDFGRFGIRCNCICPGYMQTDMLDDYYATAEDPVAMRAAIQRMHPIGRIGDPSDVAQTALWLASDGSRFVTGQCFVVDGGLTAGRTAGIPEGV